MKIRKAQIEDSYAIADLTFMAMTDICYAFIGEKSETKARSFLKTLIKQSNNQYSHENAWVLEIDGIIAASAIVYDGGQLIPLRKNVIEILASHYQQKFDFEDETEAGEWYLDTIAVNPDFRGKGLGSKLLSFLIKEYVGKNSQPLGLLVDLENPQAKKLYLNLGFEPVGLKTLAGQQLEHLQYRNILV